jgi:hypothetical protein
MKWLWGMSALLAWHSININIIKTPQIIHLNETKDYIIGEVKIR